MSGSGGPDPAGADRLVRVVLDDSRIARWTPELAHERRLAAHDLAETGRLALATAPGPYAVRIALVEERMAFEVSAAAGGAPLARFAVPVGDLRRLVSDYHALCRSYYEAIAHAPRARIEALDMGRRAIHDEGAGRLGERVRAHAATDDETARRLFTVLSVMRLSGDPELFA